MPPGFQELGGFLAYSDGFLGQGGVSHPSRGSITNSASHGFPFFRGYPLRYVPHPDFLSTPGAVVSSLLSLTITKKTFDF